MTLLGKHAASIAVVGGLFLKEGEISYLCNHDKYPRYPHSQFPSMDIEDNDNHVVLKMTEGTPEVRSDKDILNISQRYPKIS